MSDPVRKYNDIEEQTPQDLNQSGADYGMTFNNEENIPFGYKPEQPAQQAQTLQPQGQAVQGMTGRRAEDILKTIYSNEPPAPTLDQARLDRVKRMGRINQIGQGVGVLGNILSLGLGGNVEKSAPDTTTPFLMQEYQKTLDKYKDQQDIYELRKFQKKVDDQKMAYGDAVQKEGRDLEQSRFDAGIQEREKDRAERAKQYAEQSQNMKDRMAHEGKQLEETTRHNKALEGVAYENAKANNTRATKYGSSTGKPYHQVVVNGKTLPMDRGQYNELYARMIADPVFAQKNLRVRMSDFGQNPRAGMDIDIAKYAQHNPQVVQEVLGGAGEESLEDEPLYPTGSNIYKQATGNINNNSESWY